MPQVVGSCEQPIAFETQENVLEKIAKIGEAITAPLEHLTFVVVSFKATGLEIDDVIGNGVPMAMQGLEKAVETGQPTLEDLRFPSANSKCGIPALSQLNMLMKLLVAVSSAVSSPSASIGSVSKVVLGVGRLALGSGPDAN